MEKDILAGLEPQKVFTFFEELSRIPHGSGNTGAASSWAKAFAEKRGLRHRQDAVGNVIIWKDASAGYEDHPAVMLQGHLDMVCVKDVEHDFLKDPLELYIDGDWIKARGTTLGGDDGIAVAMAMAVLDDDTIPHPPLEVLFTVGEEVGRYGANALDASDLQSRCLINIDSEAEGILTVGCAGGARADITKTMPAASGIGNVCTVVVSGLKGGHSGVDINKGRVNANKLLVDYLSQLSGPRLISLHGGEQDNAIPVRAEAAVLLKNSELDEAEAKIWDWGKRWKADFSQDADWCLVIKYSGEQDTEALSAEDSRTVLQLLQEMPNGIRSMEPDLPGQVRTSLNLGVLRLEKGALRFSFCVRSSSGAEKEQLFQDLRTAAEKYGASYSQHGEYPAWEYRKDSRLRETMVRIFRKQYGRDPVVETIHAGLECGLLSEKLPGLDAVSMGPDMLDIHSTRERMSIASVQRTWRYLLEILSEL